MTTTFVTRTAAFVPALQAAQAQAVSRVQQGAPVALVAGTGMSVAARSATSDRGRSHAAAPRTGLAVDVIASAERHVAVNGTRQVSPVLGSTVVGSVINGPVLVGTAVFGKGDVPALRTWRPPV